MFKQKTPSPGVATGARTETKYSDRRAPAWRLPPAAHVDRRPPASIARPWPGSMAERRILACALVAPRLTGEILRAAGLRPDIIDPEIRAAVGFAIRGLPVPDEVAERLAEPGPTFASWLDASTPWVPCGDDDVAFSLRLAIEDLRAELAPAMLRFHADRLEAGAGDDLSGALAELVLTGRAPGEGA